MEKLYHITIIIVFCLAISWGCSDPFSFSPFEAKVDNAFRNTTEKNLEKIRALDTLTGTDFKVALISDPHYHFNELIEAVEDINKKEEYVFTIVTGDITENGLLKEYELFHSIMAKSKIPYVTVIGNHDYLSNGGQIYEQIYGALNYTFTFNGVKFIAWDNTIWESEKEADYNWLESVLTNSIEATSTDSVRHKIPLSHIPPFDGQLADNRYKFHKLLLDQKVKLSIHGHKHEYTASELLGDGIIYMTVGSPQKRNYAELIVMKDSVAVRKIEY